MLSYNPFKGNVFGVMNNQMFFDVRNGGGLATYADYPASDFSVAGVLAFFGHHIQDQEVLEAMRQAARDNKFTGKIFNLFIYLFQLYILFQDRHIPQLKRKLFEEDWAEIVRPMSALPLQDKFAFIYHSVITKYEVFELHVQVSLASFLKSMLLLKVLKRSSDTAHLEEDLNLLMSHCSDVVSAEVPNMLREVARTIKDKSKFAQLSDEEALRVLKNSKDSSSEGQAGKLFEQFLAKHGHRCYRELDPLYKTWATNPIPCVQVIKVKLILIQD